MLMTESTSGGFDKEKPARALFQSPGPLDFSNAGCAYHGSLDVISSKCRMIRAPQVMCGEPILRAAHACRTAACVRA